MQSKITWQANSVDPNKSEKLDLIRQWWANLNNKEIIWRQRIIPDGENLHEINWEDQKFDEKFSLQNPDLRGITLFWYKSDLKDEKNTTVTKLELDLKQQQLYIYPQSQPKLIIRVEQAAIKYQTISLKDPKIAGTSIGSDQVILLQDPQQQIEVKLTLSSQGLAKLLESLPG